MSKENEKIKEPYKPEDTPKPPHIIEPNSGRERENPVEGKRKSERAPDKGEENKGEKQHLLNEESDISDETTI